MRMYNIDLLFLHIDLNNSAVEQYFESSTLIVCQLNLNNNSLTDIPGNSSIAYM